MKCLEAILKTVWFIFEHRKRKPDFKIYNA